MLPAAERAGAPCCCARRTCAGRRRATCVVSSTTPPRCGIRGWYCGAYAAWQRRLLPRARGRGRGGSITVSRVLPRGARGTARRRPGAGVVVPGGVDPRFTPARTRRARGARSAWSGPTCCASPRTPRARTSRALVPAARALAADGVELVVAGGHRPQFAAEQGLEACGCSATSTTRAARPLRGRRGVRRCRRSTRASGCRCWRRWRPARPWSTTTARRAPRDRAAARRGSPSRPGGVRDALPALLADAGERERLRAAGLERAGAFSWDRTAREIDALLIAEAG